MRKDAVRKENYASNSVYDVHLDVFGIVYIGIRQTCPAPCGSVPHDLATRAPLGAKTYLQFLARFITIYLDTENGACF